MRAINAPLARRGAGAAGARAPARARAVAAAPGLLRRRCPAPRLALALKPTARGSVRVAAAGGEGGEQKVGNAECRRGRAGRLAASA
jgi:hypothetical protein